jgi:hypothetical protein
MPDNGLGPDLSFLNEKVKPDGRVYVPHLVGFNKQAARTQVSDS